MTVKITGGIPLLGEVKPVPNKNAVLSAIPAAILSSSPITYTNLPETTDVAKLLKILELLGVKVTKSEGQTVIDASNINSYRVDKELGELIRSSIMLVGPLLARFGRAEVPIPGGCVLGQRSIHAHIDVFTKVGCSVEFVDDYVIFTAPKRIEEKYDIWQFEASVTATENFAMYASGSSAKFTLTDAACEPHVSQLLELLSDMGANISGIGSNKLEIIGNTKLHQASFTALPDHIDIAGIIVAAGVTKGTIKILGGNIPWIIGGLVQTFKKFNIKFIMDNADLIVDATDGLKVDSKNSGFPLASDGLPKFIPRPWPGFPADALPLIVPLACKTPGQMLVQNWIYESGLDFIRELNHMGGQIFMCDPQRVIVNGSVNFTGGRVTPPGVIQAHVAVFLASLCDPVETIIEGAESLSRRYVDYFEVYKKLGAKIEILT